PCFTLEAALAADVDEADGDARFVFVREVHQADLVTVCLAGDIHDGGDLGSTQGRRGIGDSGDLNAVDLTARDVGDAGALPSLDIASRDVGDAGSLSSLDIAPDH